MIESMVPAASGALGFHETLGSGESCDEPFVSVAAAAAAAAAGPTSRLRLMCTFGGRIVPRTSDKSLYYVGGDNRMVIVDRRESLADLAARISHAVYSGRPFILKYQLPNEDLDSLISVTADEDLENMIEEYDRILDSSLGRLSSTATGGGSNRPGRLRLFLFPAKSESAPASTIESLLDNSQSESWFVDAFNNAMSGLDGTPRGHSADAASVDSLLGLADDSSVLSLGRAASVSGGDSKTEQFVLPRPDSYGKLTRQGQEVHSVPDSPMLDNSSSFGSNSSSPPLSNLPPIRPDELPPIRPDELPPSHQIAALDDQFSYLNLASHAASTTALAMGIVEELKQSYKQPDYAAQHQPHSIFLPSSPTSQVTSISSDDNKSDHGGTKNLQPAIAAQIDALMPDSVSSTDLWKALPVSSETGLQVPIAVSESSAGYPLLPEQLRQEQHKKEQLQQEHQQKEQLQQEQEQHQQAFQFLLNQQLQQQQQQQQQFIPAASHYIHHPATGTIVPLQSYYPFVAHPIQQTQQAHPYNQQIPIYYFQVPQSPYNVTMQPKVGNPNSITSGGATALHVPQANPNPELPMSLYGTVVAAPSSASLQPQLIHVGAEHTYSYAGIGCSVLQQHNFHQSPATMPGYAYDYSADPARALMYYSQATLPLVSSPQYQTVSSSSVNVDAMAQRDMRPTRAS